MLFGVYFASQFLWLGYVMLRNGFNISRKPLSEYNNLFAVEVQDKLQEPYVYKSKIREPESNYILPDDFHLTVKKIDLRFDKSLSEIIKLEYKQSQHIEQPFSSYSEDSRLNLQATEREIDTVSTISLRYQGISIITMAKNDTLVCYYLRFKRISISYDGNSYSDIWGESQGATDAVISLAFLKKKKSLYIIMLFKTKDENRDFQPDMLYSLIKK